MTNIVSFANMKRLLSLFLLLFGNRTRRRAPSTMRREIIQHRLKLLLETPRSSAGQLIAVHDGCVHDSVRRVSGLVFDGYDPMRRLGKQLRDQARVQRMTRFISDDESMEWPTEQSQVADQIESFVAAELVRET